MARGAPLVIPALSLSEPPAAPSRAPLPVVGGIGLSVALLAILMLAKLDWLHGVREWWSGDKVKLEVLVQGSWWWGAAAGILTLLGLTARWWARPWPAAFPQAAPAAPRWFWLGVAGLIG